MSSEGVSPSDLDKQLCLAWKADMMEAWVTGSLCHGSKVHLKKEMEHHPPDRQVKRK